MLGCPYHKLVAIEILEEFAPILDRGVERLQVVADDKGNRRQRAGDAYASNHFDYVAAAPDAPRLKHQFAIIFASSGRLGHWLP